MEQQEEVPEISTQNGLIFFVSLVCIFTIRRDLKTQVDLQFNYWDSFCCFLRENPSWRERGVSEGKLVRERERGARHFWWYERERR